MIERGIKVNPENIEALKNLVEPWYMKGLMDV